MECHSCTLGKALQTVRNHLSAQRSEPLSLEAKVDNTVRSVGQIDDGAGQGFVERSVGVAEAGEAGWGAEGFGEGIAQGDADVFSSVVVVDFVALVLKPITKRLGETAYCEGRLCSSAQDSSLSASPAHATYDPRSQYQC